MSRELTKTEVREWAKAVLFGREKSYTVKQLEELKQECIRVGYEGYANMCDNQIAYIESKIFLDAIRAEKVGKLKAANIKPFETRLSYQPGSQDVTEVIFRGYVSDIRLRVQKTTAPRTVFEADPIHIGLPGTEIVPTKFDE